MARKIISQAEAYRMKNQLRMLERQDQIRFNRYRNEFPGGVHAQTFTITEVTEAALDMAQRLGCALVAKSYNNELRIYAVPRK